MRICELIPLYIRRLYSYLYRIIHVSIHAHTQPGLNTSRASHLRRSCLLLVVPSQCMRVPRASRPEFSSLLGLHCPAPICAYGVRQVSDNIRGEGSSANMADGQGAVMPGAQSALLQLSATSEPGGRGPTDSIIGVSTGSNMCLRVYWTRTARRSAFGT